jgi:hypothetical protein
VPLLSTTAPTSEQIRVRLVEALRLDLVGPANDHAFAKELLPESPRRWYLTGYLVPTTLPSEKKTEDDGVEDEIDSPAEQPASDDGAEVDRTAAKKGLLPSSIGLSVLAAKGIDLLTATVEWGDYAYEGPQGSEAADGSSTQAEGVAGAVQKAVSGLRGYRRYPKTAQARIDLAAAEPGKPFVTPLDGSDGLRLVTTVREVPATTLSGSRLPAGTRSVAVFLVNERTPDLERPYTRFAFQPRLRLETPQGSSFVPRPDLRGGDGGPGGEDSDEKVADVQYRDVVDYAVGHGVSACWDRDAEGRCHFVETIWIPDADVERVEPRALQGVTLGMEELGRLADGAAATAALLPLVEQYRTWIDGQSAVLVDMKGSRHETTSSMLADMKTAAKRIEAGISMLAESPKALEAFRIANRAMAATARRREWYSKGRNATPADVTAPAWRPFQLAFILLALNGLTEESHRDRERVDLLFFPTGGGKTEAYLGLAAYTIVLRRLMHGTPLGCGLAVLMRYTLRLLTLDQLGRAAALICALELERQKDTAKLGSWPFEIGLWVGSAATPNRMGKRGDTGPGSDETAYARTNRFKRNPGSNAAPIPIEECPWCGAAFTADSFRLTPNDKDPKDLRVTCSDHTCDFTGDNPLPIIGVDEPIYRRLPCFLIATVDKFAALPWTGQTGTLFGLVDRYDADGFYGPCDSGKGAPLGRPSLPGPDLVIQDELHLISGPLGTIAGVYESAIDALASRSHGGRRVRPKIVASTATVRRAPTQVRALFERMETHVFPPPGPDRHDSFFAVTVPPSKRPARLYVGVAAQGRSQKVVFLRTMLALAAAAERLWEENGGAKNQANPVDPYMTSLGYFNSLRELGGSRRIVEDEVCTRLEQYGERRRREPTDTLFARRSIQRDVLELTSRVSTGQVAATKSRLAKPFHDTDRVDTALATNMISVGLDITRLGLMMVLGQPKTSAEYIQATSRVGRDPNRPGLVVTIFNIHKPRDRSHYERFGSYHASFYRSVEATSVTPFSPRALDRALVGTLVALVRHFDPRLTPPRGAELVPEFRNGLTDIANRLAERARAHCWPPTADAGQATHDHVLHRCTSLLDDWVNIVEDLRQSSTHLEYQKEQGGGARLLFSFLDPELKDVGDVRRRFKANRSMRDVEPSVILNVRRL